MLKNKPLTANDVPQVYEELGIDLTLLGALMLDVEAPAIVIPQEFKDALYYTESPSHFWIKGYVFETTPHMTLFYGFMRPAEEWKKQIEELVAGADMPAIKIKSVGFFNSPYEADPYYCLVAHLEPSPAMDEMRQRLELLPHINTYPEFRPHVTIAYIKRDELTRNKMIAFFHSKLKGRALKVTGLNFGGQH